MLMSCQHQRRPKFKPDKWLHSPYVNLFDPTTSSVFHANLTFLILPPHSRPWSCTLSNKNWVYQFTAQLSRIWFIRDGSRVKGISCKQKRMLVQRISTILGERALQSSRKKSQKVVTVIDISLSRSTSAIESPNARVSVDTLSPITNRNSWNRTHNSHHTSGDSAAILAMPPV